MADKTKMKCNRPVPSDRAGKKKMVKACSNGKEKLIMLLLLELMNLQQNILLKNGFGQIKKSELRITKIIKLLVKK